MSKPRYYFVGFAHSLGFGNMFFEAEPYLDIMDAEKMIAENKKVASVAIISISEIHKGQFVPKPEAGLTVESEEI